MKKLIKIQSELKAPKDQVNSFGKYNYRSCEDILEAVKPLLKAEGCLVTISDEIVSVGEHNYVKATARFQDGDFVIENSAFAKEAIDKKGMDPSQITGSASSYARKYALNGLFLIDDSKMEPVTDPDSDAHKKLQSQPKEEKPKAVRQSEPNNLIDDTERARLKTLCKENKIDLGWLIEEAGVKNGMMTKPQYAKAIGIINNIIAEKEREN